MYRELSQEGAMTTCEAGSHLIMALCRAGQHKRALRVFNDMVMTSKQSHLTLRPQESQPILQSQQSPPDAAVLTVAEQLGIRTSLAGDNSDKVSFGESTSLQVLNRPPEANEQSEAKMTNLRRSWRYVALICLTKFSHFNFNYRNCSISEYRKHSCELMEYAEWRDSGNLPYIQ